jgi:hypothetical protein
LACTTLAVVSCSETVPAPQPILLGQTTCARCHNVIHSLDAAAEAIYAAAPPRFYDDIGCLATDPEADTSGAQFYVQQAGGKGWARTQDITFASPPGTHTPRGYNYLAYPEEEARNLAPDHWARGWDDLRRELLQKR